MVWYCSFQQLSLYCLRSWFLAQTRKQRQQRPHNLPIPANPAMKITMICGVSASTGSVPIDCENCHRLTGGEGSHPEFPYSVESQALTCDTCHAEKSKEWTSSRHGEIDLGCATCHEPHSQQQKVLDDNQLICANCHKAQFEAAHDSTHMAAGLSCENCHLGEDSGHTFKATIASCESCHSDIHEANQLIAAGVMVEPVATEPAEALAEATEPAVASVEATAETVMEETAAESPEKSGINLPFWLLLIAGFLIGGIGAWACAGYLSHPPGFEQ